MPKRRQYASQASSSVSPVVALSSPILPSFTLARSQHVHGSSSPGVSQTSMQLSRFHFANGESDSGRSGNNGVLHVIEKETARPNTCPLRSVPLQPDGGFWARGDSCEKFGLVVDGLGWIILRFSDDRLGGYLTLDHFRWKRNHRAFRLMLRQYSPAVFAERIHLLASSCWYGWRSPSLSRSIRSILAPTDLATRSSTVPLK